MGCLKLTEYKQKLPRRWILLSRDFRQKNAEGKWGYYAYDVKGQKIAEWGENTYPTRYEFDAFGNMISLYTFRNPNAVITSEPSPADGDKTAWNYDVASNMLLSKTFANNKANTYTYNPTGTLKSRTWARGITTTYTYDTFKQLLKTSYSDATPTITNTYNAMGEIKAITDIKGTTSFTYNNYGQVISESISGLYNKTLTHNYDNFGRNIGYSLDNVNKAVYNYSEHGRLIGLNIGGANFSFEYMNNANLLSKTIYPNGLERIISYEEKRNLITEVKNTLLNDIISQYSYTNDVLGRRINMGIYYNNTQKSNEYNYNPRSEVIGAQGNDLNQAFDYDNIGNRITSSNNDITTNYSTNELNQYTTENTFIPTYDADGNQTKIKTSMGEWIVTYNGENRPIKFTQGNKTIEMKYDYMGRRVQYISKTGNTLNKDRRYMYNGYTLVQEMYNTNQVYMEFTWDPTAGTATKPLMLAFPTEGKTLFYFHDANKNVTEVAYMATHNGIGAHYEYDTFGNIITNTRNSLFNFDSNNINPFRFSSEYFDSELDLIYYNYRHYNPQSGRWLSRDPIAEEGGYNLYGICNNNVINICDFYGLFGIPTLCTKCGGAIGSCGCNKITIPITPPFQINSAWDAYEYFKSGAGGRVPAGATLINDVKNSAGYKNYLTNIVDVRTAAQLRSVPFCETTGKFDRTGLRPIYTGTNSLGHIDIQMEPTQMTWTASSWSKKCTRTVTGKIAFEITFEDDYEFVFDLGNWDTIVTDIIPGIIAGPGRNYKIYGGWNDFRTLEVEQECKK